MKELTHKLISHSEQHFDPGSMMNMTIQRKLLEVYTSPDSLGDLGFINKYGKEFDVLKPRSIGPFRTEKALQQAYEKE